MQPISPIVRSHCFLIMPVFLFCSHYSLTTSIYGVIHKPCRHNFGLFWPPSPLWTILLNRAYVVIWTFSNPPPAAMSTWFVNAPLCQFAPSLPHSHQQRTIELQFSNILYRWLKVVSKQNVRKSVRKSVRVEIEAFYNVLKKAAEESGCSCSNKL